MVADIQRCQFFCKKMNEVAPADIIAWQNELLAFRYPSGKAYSQTYLKTIYAQRKSHRLPEWRDFCAWIETLPMFKELCLEGTINE